MRTLQSNESWSCCSQQHQSFICNVFPEEDQLNCIREDAFQWTILYMTRI